MGLWSVGVLLIGTAMITHLSAGKAVASQTCPATQVAVSVCYAWDDTGILVHEEDPVTIVASGMVCYNYTCDPMVGPEGSGLDPGADEPLFLAPGLPTHSLIGKIGLSGDPFYIGPRYEFVALSSGTLYLSMNEMNDSPVRWSDNQGSWSACIETKSAPPPVEEAVPEPATLALLGSGSAAMCAYVGMCLRKKHRVGH